jgi:hypothetical protein
MVVSGLFLVQKYTCDLAMISHYNPRIRCTYMEQGTLMQQFDGECYLSLVFLLEKLLVTFFLCQ